MAARELIDLMVKEVSGVDHPAHMQEGFVVMKSADAKGADRLLETLTKGTTVTTDKKTLDAQATEKIRKALEAGDAEALRAAIDEAVPAEVVAEAVAEVAPVVAPVAEVAPEVDVTDVEAVLKSLPEPVRALITKAQDTANDALAQLADKEAIEKARSLYKNLGLDDETVKALRRLEGKDATLAKSVAGLLSNVDARMDGLSLLKELGTGGDLPEGEATVELTKRAEALVTTGGAETLKIAKSKVLAGDAILAGKIRAEKEKK